MTRISFALHAAVFVVTTLGTHALAAEKSVGRGWPATVTQASNVSGGVEGEGQQTAREGASPAGHHAAAGRSVHHEGLLPGRCALVRSPLLPLQQPLDAAGHVGRRRRRHGQAHRLGSAGKRVMGPLRNRLSARGHRLAVSVQDRARTLRGLARRNEGQGRPDRLHAREAAARLERALQPCHVAQVHGRARRQTYDVAPRISASRRNGSSRPSIRRRRSCRC